uniref:Alternative protein CDRT1 n=1 Tax=Homo sapiens TaxID=9606 RepID=L0R4W0_HUMAN|nr:alternative protein CDRT1 [Homo sapiens]
MCVFPLRKTTAPSLRPHKSIGQPKLSTHPFLCPKPQKMNTSLGQHLTLRNHGGIHSGVYPK